MATTYYYIPNVIADEVRHYLAPDYQSGLLSDEVPLAYDRRTRKNIWSLDLDNVRDAAAWRYLIWMALSNITDSEHVAWDRWKCLSKATRAKYIAIVEEALESSGRLLLNYGATPEMLNGTELGERQIEDWKARYPEEYKNY